MVVNRQQAWNRPGALYRVCAHQSLTMQLSGWRIQSSRLHGSNPHGKLPFAMGCWCNVSELIHDASRCSFACCTAAQLQQSGRVYLYQVTASLPLVLPAAFDDTVVACGTCACHGTVTHCLLFCSLAPMYCAAEVPSRPVFTTSAVLKGGSLCIYMCCWHLTALCVLQACMVLCWFVAAETQKKPGRCCSDPTYGIFGNVLSMVVHA